MNTFGQLFRISIFGESHGNSVGVVIDGTPAGISISEEDLLEDLSRRKSGAKGTTPRLEKDLPKITQVMYLNNVIFLVGLLRTICACTHRLLADQ